MLHAGALDPLISVSQGRAQKFRQKGSGTRLHSRHKDVSCKTTPFAFSSSLDYVNFAAHADPEPDPPGRSSSPRSLRRADPSPHQPYLRSIRRTDAQAYHMHSAAQVLKTDSQPNDADSDLHHISDKELRPHL
ncbi:uncharacterized protein SCHCODRAFT_01096941 [Schizophyllum commune H4-8]|nr:uncharacterized protein SCHCODRAFT_01096941 [Schizophyllum commune H4-8]KAI5890935.1 hypothetical protein SCHCODRAFT_01096941 [Schizophyllum commune H4-8]